MKRRREVLTWKEVVKRAKFVVPELTGAGVLATPALGLWYYKCTTVYKERLNRAISRC